MFITTDSAGHITGRYNTKQPGLNCIEVTAEQLAAVAYPKWDKTAKKIVNDADAHAVADAEQAYGYARARAQAYVAAFSKEPAKKNPVDAIGHVLDAILSHFEGDDTALNAILAKRAEIKQANPKA